MSYVTWILSNENMFHPSYLNFATSQRFDCGSTFISYKPKNPSENAAGNYAVVSSPALFRLQITPGSMCVIIISNTPGFAITMRSPYHSLLNSCLLVTPSSLDLNNMEVLFKSKMIGHVNMSVCFYTSTDENWERTRQRRAPRQRFKQRNRVVTQTGQTIATCEDASRLLTYGSAVE